MRLRAIVDIVTGAFGYTGRYIAALLTQQGRRIRTLTNHPTKILDESIEQFPYDFENPETMVEAIRGADTFYNTYWIRFARGAVDFDIAVRNSRTLIDCALEAQVRRFVHISITKPDAASPYPYFRGKAEVESSIKASGISYAIVRPTVVFGDGDILVNNIAWMLRKFPFFPIPRSGSYRVRPVYVGDVARLCTEAASSDKNIVEDALGPETLTFDDMVRTIGTAVGRQPPIVNLPLNAAYLLSFLVSRVANDKVITVDELGGLMDELIYVEGPATGSTSFSNWVMENGATLGTRYASELDRHFRTPSVR